MGKKLINEWVLAHYQEINIETSYSVIFNIEFLLRISIIICLFNFFLSFSAMFTRVFFSLGGSCSKLTLPGKRC